MALWASGESSRRMSELEFSGFDVMSYYLSVWFREFLDYPWVVQVSYTIIALCTLAVLVLAVSMLVLRMKYGRKDRFARFLQNRYYDACRRVCEHPADLSESEVSRQVGFEDKHWKGWRMKALCRFFVELRADCGDSLNQRNLTTLVRLFRLNVYLEEKLTFGFSTNKVRYLQVAQYLHLYVPESILVRLLNSRNSSLSKSVRMYYLWCSDYEPFRFLGKKGLYNYRPLDGMEFHDIMRDRHATGKIIPSFRPYIAVLENVYLKSFLIREVAHWGTDEDVEAMKVFFDDDEFVYRQAAFLCMGIRRYVPAEEEMEATYSRQTEPLRRYLIEAVCHIGSGRAVGFFTRVYEETASHVTRYTAIRSLYNYGEAGRLQFQRLRQAATGQNRLLFDQVEAFSQSENQLPMLAFK